MKDCQHEEKYVFQSFRSDVLSTALLQQQYEEDTIVHSFQSCDIEKVGVLCSRLRGLRCLVFNKLKLRRDMDTRDSNAWQKWCRAF